MAESYSTQSDLFGEPETVPVKVCSTCKAAKPVTEFYPNRTSRSLHGVMSKCKECAKKYSRQVAEEKSRRRQAEPPRPQPPHTCERCNAAAIPPFPAEVDRGKFGDWLSGFSDGEGCFDLRVNKKSGSLSARFQLVLRGDCADILREIQAYWQCGIISDRTAQAHVNPQIDFGVTRICDLFGVLLPHFESYPLRGNKRRDFEVWKAGVVMLHDIYRRNFSWRGIGGGAGRVSKVTEAERADFATLIQALRRRRTYGAVVELPGKQE